MFKKIILIIIVVLVVIVIGGGLYFWNQISWSVSDSETETIFTIVEGEGVKEIGANLKKEGLIRSPFWFETYVFLDGSQSQFLAGNYILRENMNTREVVATLTSGQGTSEQVITIIEGWNISEIAEYLEEQGLVPNRESFVAIASVSDSRTIIADKAYSFLNDKPAGQGLEGYLFPDTYRIFEDAEAADIIERMLDNFGIKFTDQMEQDSAAGNMSIYEIVTLASIIEKEVSKDEDRKIVAGIFYNRLNNNIGMQSDATVNYVTKGDRPQPTAEDLEADSPYNTYKYRGLPPGPISNPSLSSLMAAIYPESTDYYYFLNRINEDGSTVFSKTYEEHLENKRKYLQ